MIEEAEIESLKDLFEELKGGLDRYASFVNTTNPKHKGIPYLTASETFSSSPLHAYGKFRKRFKDLTQRAGLTSILSRATGWGGWTYHHSRAMGILFPRANQETKVVMGQPTLVPAKVEKDPERAKTALPHLQKMIDLISRDLIDLETTVKSDPETFTHGEDDLIESVLMRIWRENDN